MALVDFFDTPHVGLSVPRLTSRLVVFTGSVVSMGDAEVVTSLVTGTMDMPDISWG